MLKKRIWLVVVAVAFAATACNKSVTAPEPKALDDSMSDTSALASPPPTTGSENHGEVVSSGVSQPQLSATLQGDGEKATVGQRVHYVLRVADAPNAVTAFGLDLSYDPTALEYLGWSRGELTKGFTQVDLVGHGEGSLRCGGFTVEGPIPSGSTGVLAQIEFEVKTDVAPRLELSNRVDDLSTFEVAK